MRAPVVSDKPIAATADTARALADVAEAEGRLLIPFQNRRWDSDIRTAQRVLAEGRPVERTLVVDIMTTLVITCGADEELEVAELCFRGTPSAIALRTALALRS